MYQANLLLLEDCSELREILHWDIEQNFPLLNVLSTSSYLESEKILENNQIHFVISDYYLNGHTGLELYSKYRNETSFIIMSGDSSVRSTLKDFDISFIEKPFNSLALKKTIEIELNKKGFLNSTHSAL